MTSRSLAIVLGVIAVSPVVGAAQSVAHNTLADSSVPTTDSARAADLVQKIRASFQGTDMNAAAAAAERYLAQLDAIAGALPQKISGHRVLQSYYGNYDIDDKLESNARTILALVKQLPATIQPRAVRIVSATYGDLASLQANALHPDSAIATLQAAPAAFPGIPGLREAFASDIARYQMIGQKAPALHADYWLNRAAGAPSMVWDSVSVVVFTANWCHSCKDSYPTLAQLVKDDASRGLRVVLAVMLDGQFQGTDMAPVQEVAANKEYYVTHHGFQVPIAIQESADAAAADTTTATKASRSDPRNDATFMVRGLPQFMVIDRTGTIRAILTGWDPYGRRQHALTTIVTQLVAKPGVARGR